MKSFCIIGLGKFGTALAETLSKNGKQVLVIDVDADKINAIADKVTAAVIGDPTNEAVFKAAGIENYECAIVCMVGNINDNVLLTMNLKELGIKKVVGRAINEGHKKVLQKIGADMIIFPEEDMGERLGNLLSKDNLSDFIDFNGYNIAEIQIPKDWVGKNLIDLQLRKKFNVNVIGLRDGNGALNLSPSPERAFREDDKISVIGTEKDIEKLTKHI